MDNLYNREEIEEFIRLFKLDVSTDYVINYWAQKSWKTAKGTPVKTLSAAVNVANSLYLENIRKGYGSESAVVSDIMKINKRIIALNLKYGKNIPLIPLTE